MKLLFIPGAGGGKGQWIYQTEYFPNSDAVALPGHPEGRPYPSVDDYVAWLRGYIHRHRYQDVVLVGHSMGGGIAQLYGLRYGGEVKALVLIGTGTRLRVLPAFLAALEAMITDEDAWRKYLENTYRLVDPKIRQAVIAERLLIGPAVMLNDMLCCHQFDIMDKVDTIKLPSLIICGRQDDMTPVKYTHYLATRIEGATEVIVDGAGHRVFMEKPEAVNQAIEEFLGRLN